MYVLGVLLTTECYLHYAIYPQPSYADSASSIRAYITMSMKDERQDLFPLLFVISGHDRNILVALSFLRK